MLSLLFQTCILVYCVLLTFLLLTFLDQFTAKSRNSNVIEGVCGETTTTHLLYNKFGISFAEDRFPVLFKSLVELIKFSHSRYQLFYINYGLETGNTTLLSQLLSGSSTQQHENGGRLSISETKHPFFQSATDVHTEQLFASLLPDEETLSCEEDKDTMPFGNICGKVFLAPTTTSIPIKVFEDYRKIQCHQDISLRINKDLIIKTSDIMMQDTPPLRPPMHSPAPNKKHWSPTIISKRWRVRDARSNEFIFLCFESKTEAFNRAVTIFDLKDSAPIASPGSADVPVLVQATGLLILREGGRSLKQYHNKSVLGHPNLSSSFVQELLVSEESTLLHLSPRKRNTHSSCEQSYSPKRAKVASPNNEILANDEVTRATFTLSNCRFLGMSVPMSSSRHPIAHAPPSQPCENVDCEGFLWQLLDVPPPPLPPPLPPLSPSPPPGGHSS
jgi:hypothetical protein